MNYFIVTYNEDNGNANVVNSEGKVFCSVNMKHKELSIKRAEFIAVILNESRTQWAHYWGDVYLFNNEPK